MRFMFIPCPACSRKCRHRVASALVGFDQGWGPKRSHRFSIHRRRFRKYLECGMMNPTLFNLPIKDSRSLDLILLRVRRDCRSWAHIWTLSGGKLIVKDLVLMTYPSTVWISAGVPSALSFLSAREGSRSTVSAGSGGRKKQWRTRGTACWPLGWSVGVLRLSVIASSM